MCVSVKQSAPLRPRRCPCLCSLCERYAATAGLNAQGRLLMAIYSAPPTANNFGSPQGAFQAIRPYAYCRFSRHATGGTFEGVGYDSQDQGTTRQRSRTEHSGDRPGTRDFLVFDIEVRFRVRQALANHIRLGFEQIAHILEENQPQHRVLVFCGRYRPPVGRWQLPRGCL